MFGEKEEEEEDEVGLEAIRICFILLLPVVAAATPNAACASLRPPPIQGIEASTALRPPVRPCLRSVQKGRRRRREGRTGRGEERSASRRERRGEERRAAYVRECVCEWACFTRVERRTTRLSCWLACRRRRRRGRSCKNTPPRTWSKAAAATLLLLSNVSLRRCTIPPIQPARKKRQREGERPTAACPSSLVSLSWSPIARCKKRVEVQGRSSSPPRLSSSSSRSELQRIYNDGERRDRV